MPAPVAGPRPSPLASPPSPPPPSPPPPPPPPPRPMPSRPVLKPSVPSPPPPMPLLSVGDKVLRPPPLPLPQDDRSVQLAMAPTPPPAPTPRAFALPSNSSKRSDSPSPTFTETEDDTVLSSSVYSPNTSSATIANVQVPRGRPSSPFATSIQSGAVPVSVSASQSISASSSAQRSPSTSSPPSAPSSPSAPRRPRAGTTLPFSHRKAVDYDLSPDDIAAHPIDDHPQPHSRGDIANNRVNSGTREKRHARDEFEEQFLARMPSITASDSIDVEAQMINAVLDRVEFRQIGEDEEDDIISDDGHVSHSLDFHVPSSSRCASNTKGDLQPNPRVIRRRSTAYPATTRRKTDGDSPIQRPPFNADEFDPEFATIDLHREKNSSVSEWCEYPPEVGVPGCHGCDRFAKENRRLRRQLDELEFELASTVVTRGSDSIADDFDAANFGDDHSQHSRNLQHQSFVHPSLSHLGQASHRKHKSWTSRLLHTASLASSSSRPSERARLKSEVKALSVTTEYLWRKLNKAEIELRQYRLKDIRSKMNGNVHGSPSNGFKRTSNDRSQSTDDDDDDIDHFN